MDTESLEQYAMQVYTQEMIKKAFKTKSLLSLVFEDGKRSHSKTKFGKKESVPLVAQPTMSFIRRAPGISRKTDMV